MAEFLGQFRGPLVATVALVHGFLQPPGCLAGLRLGRLAAQDDHRQRYDGCTTAVQAPCCHSRPPVTEQRVHRPWGALLNPSAACNSGPVQRGFGSLRAPATTRTLTDSPAVPFASVSPCAGCGF